MCMRKGFLMYFVDVAVSQASQELVMCSKQVNHLK